MKFEASLIPIAFGAIFYWLGKETGQQALELVDPSNFHAIQNRVRLATLSCLMGSFSFLIFLLPIVLIAMIANFLQKQSRTSAGRIEK